MVNFSGVLRMFVKNNVFYTWSEVKTNTYKVELYNIKNIGV